MTSHNKKPEGKITAPEILMKCFPVFFRSISAPWLLLAATFVLDAGLPTKPTAPAIGTLFLVNSTGDQPEATPDSQCETAVGNGVCTLRAAIQLVNTRNNGADGIFIGVTGTITLNSALPSLSTAVSISGPGANQLIVQPNTSPATFRIFNVTTTGTVSFSGITINGGRAIDSAGGGGIRNFTTGTVNVTNCTLSNNSGLNGGGIANSSNGRVFVTNCSVSGNTSQLTNGTSFGGGIYNPNGYVNITNSTLSNNTAHGGSDVGEGGGVYNNGTLIVLSSTIFDNTATSDSSSGIGGGVFNFGQLEITNSTIIENVATSAPQPPNGFSDGVGGGIYNLNTAVITNSTIAYNQSAGGTINHDAGGIENDDTAAHMQVKSCIIANNVGSGPDVSGPFTSGGFNLIGATDGSTGFTAATDLTGTASSPLDPEFAPINDDNGGSTLTLGLVCGSPAIDKGTSNGLTGSLTTDQRGTGFARTVDDTGIPNPFGGDGTDIGAFEYGAGPITVTSAASRKFHGTGNPPSHFDIPLPLNCAKTGIECRRNTGSDTSGPNAGHDHELIVTFAKNVTVSSADVASSSSFFPVGSASLSVNNQVVTVDLHNIPNAARLTVNLRGVSDGTNTGLVTIPVGVLLGDVNGSGVVTSGDANLCKGQALQPISNSNFRDDINLSGTISTGDANVIKQHALEQLPP